MKRTVITLGLVLSVSALTAFAAPESSTAPTPAGTPGQEGRGGKGQHRKFPLVEALDANGDRVIDAQEIANAPEALKKLDKNGDGKLTIDELRPQRPGQAERAIKDPARAEKREEKQGKHVHPLISALDTNGDGVIDSTEIAGAAESLKKLDKNGDGKLTREEIFPGFAAKEGHGKGERKHGGAPSQLTAPAQPTAATEKK
ncbi:MAG: hypothetical protein WCP06_00155 [Verrucomicrobiota bacterium]